MIMLCYTMNCAKNVVNKLPHLTALKNYNILIKKSTSVVNPIIIIKDDDGIIPTFNYVFIEQFARYYFVTDIIILNNNIYEIHLHCDVLNFISPTQVGFVSRQENDFNSYLIDSNRKFTKGYEVNEYTLTNGSFNFGVTDSATSYRWLLLGMGVEGV